MNLTIHHLEGVFSICRLEPSARIPDWVGEGFSSVTRTPNELSIVSESGHVPAGIHCEGGWRALFVEGPIAFSTTGIAASMTSPLAAAGISVCVIATYDTDYLLVKEADLEDAVVALREAGHRVGDR